MITLMSEWFDHTIVELRRQIRWSFLPPLLVYFAAGISGITSIVGAFFVKDYLDLSAAFLAGLAFWVGLPWALKMPIGHLVDLFWRWKALLIYFGATLIAASLLIMYALVSDPEQMAQIMAMEAWFVLSALLAPCGFVVQDAVADAMSVEAVPRVDDMGNPISDAASKSLHTTMQTLGRFALISGFVAVALINIAMFSGVEQMSEGAKAIVYGQIYLAALAIPTISISGVVLAAVQKRKKRNALRASGLADGEIALRLDPPGEETRPNLWYFGGGLAFVTLTVAIGLSDITFSREIVFIGSMAIVLSLMFQLVGALEPAKARALFGTAIIIFVFRAVPLPGAGLTWFEIDILGFDQQFLSVLTLITSVLTLVGILAFRPLMASKSISDIVVMLTLAAGILSLPNIGLYYGIHHWTAPATGGIVDARFIAVLDTAVESPLGQIAMIPMLAWIAKNAPENLKATFFAVMASFTNLALSASSLLTKYLNQIFVVTREVRDRVDDTVQTAADYSQLGWLLITVASISLLAPLATVVFVHKSRFRPTD